MPEEVSTAELLQKLALSLKSIKEELQMWHDESKRNQVAIAALSNRLDTLSRKTAIPSEIKTEIEQLKARVAEIASKSQSAGSADEFKIGSKAEGSAQFSSAQIKASLEQKLSELEREVDYIKGLEDRIKELASTSDMSDKAIQKEIEALRKEVDAIPRETPSTQKKGEEFLRALQTDLKNWHNESMENTKEITSLIKRISELEPKVLMTDNMKKDFERVMKQMESIADSIDKFKELKNLILKYNEEFQDIYSTIGKDKVELDTINDSINKLQEKLVEWSERNTENLEEISEIKKEIARLSKELKAQDTTTQVSKIADNLDSLADRVEALQRQERELQNTQRQLIEFDRKLKELVRKAVIASLSRQEFEKELEKLESGEVSESTLTRAKPNATLATPPKVSDVKEKMRKLREALQDDKKSEAVKQAGDVFSDFENELNAAVSEDQKNMLWNNLVRDINIPLKKDVEAARAKISEMKAKGQDSSKLNLLIAKIDIGMVSLETATSLRNLAKTKEIVKKLADLRNQLSAAMAA